MRCNGLPMVTFISKSLTRDIAFTKNRVQVENTPSSLSRTSLGHVDTMILSNPQENGLVISRIIGVSQYAQNMLYELEMKVSPNDIANIIVKME